MQKVLTRLWGGYKLASSVCNLYIQILRRDMKIETKPISDQGVQHDTVAYSLYGLLRLFGFSRPEIVLPKAKPVEGQQTGKFLARGGVSNYRIGNDSTTATKK